MKVRSRALGMWDRISAEPRHMIRAGLTLKAPHHKEQTEVPVGAAEFLQAGGQREQPDAFVCRAEAKEVEMKEEVYRKAIFAMEVTEQKIKYK